MQDVTSPGPSSASGPGRLPTPAHNFSNDVNRMPDTPPRQRGHRRAQSEIAFRLPEDVSFERDLGFHCSEMPALSDDTEDLFSMYIDMEQINSFSATSGISGAKASGDRGIVPLVPPYHSMSPSMDGVPAVSNGGRSSIAMASGSSIASDIRRARHQHSNSMDGSTSFKHDLLTGEFDGVDVKKVMSSDKLADIALIDPKRAKRILANRQSAARSKERKMRYISELERKVQTLQTEATTLSAQLTMLQKDSSGLTAENSELKLRLQSMEQQAQLRDALNDALREEVQRLKVATGQLNNSSGQNLGGQHFYHLQSQPLNSQQLQQLQQAQTGLDNQQQIHSEFLQHDALRLSSSFIKPEGPHNTVNHTSSTSF
ncbi:unnamed protein product [Sphagnum compactum]